MRLIAAAVLLGFSSASLAGVVMQMQDKDLQNPKAQARTQTFYFQDGAFRTETAGESEASVFHDQTMYMLDTAKKTYRKFDKAQMQNLADQLGGMRKQMEARMATLPPEQRAMIEKAMGGAGVTSGTAGKPSGPVFSVRDTGRNESAAGYDCRLWEILSDGRKEYEICAAGPAAFPSGNDMIKSMVGIGDFLSSLAKSFGGLGAGVGGYWSQIQKINGVPIITRDFDSKGKLDSETRATLVKNESIPAALFAVPAGYTEKKVNLGLPGAATGDDN
jgi:hypothetical protein